MKSLGTLACFILLAAPLFADSPAPPRAYIAAAPLGMVYFKMVPRSGGTMSRPDGFGVAYQDL